MDHQTIGDIIISNMHRRCLHEHRRCVADVSGTFLALMYIAECSPTARRCSAIYRQWYLASKHREKISMHALNFFSMSRCLGEAWRLLTYVADHSPNHWRMVAQPWRCPNVCIARVKASWDSNRKRHPHSRPNVAVRKHGTITQCCFHLGPASKTVGQH